MARLIDADEPKKRMCFKCNDEYSDEPCEPSDCVFYNAINDAPTIDAVEVLRCKHCKHYHAVIIDEKTGEIGDWGICDQPWRNEGYDINETDYCSSAEPKGGIDDYSRKVGLPVRHQQRMG